MKIRFIVCDESIHDKRFPPPVSGKINKYFNKEKRESMGGFDSQERFFMYRDITFLMEREDIRELGVFLKSLRGMIGKTQDEMALHLDIKKDRLLDIEKGKTKNISRAVYMKIAERLAIPLEQILTKFDREQGIQVKRREVNALCHRR